MSDFESTKHVQKAIRNKCIASSNKCLTSSSKKLLGTSATLVIHDGQQELILYTETVKHTPIETAGRHELWEA